MKILITAGPTREALDAVRFISNRSSGKMGLSLAAASLAAGHDATLLLGPGPADETVPSACRLVRFESAADLEQLLETHWPQHQVLIMAAAVADYRPASVFDGKLSRDPDKPMTLELAPTPDLVAHVVSTKRPDQRVIAFALEHHEALQQRATEKLRRKGVDAIVANDLAAFEADDANALWLTAAGVKRMSGQMSKPDLARWILRQIIADLGPQAIS